MLSATLDRSLRAVLNGLRGWRTGQKEAKLTLDNLCSNLDSPESTQTAFSTEREKLFDQLRDTLDTLAEVVDALKEVEERLKAAANLKVQPEAKSSAGDVFPVAKLTTSLGTLSCQLADQLQLQRWAASELALLALKPRDQATGPGDTEDPQLSKELTALTAIWLHEPALGPDFMLSVELINSAVQAL